ncbi:MAG: hypothetical protein WCU88_13745 [Elusimicrobiota bacterium]
MNLLRKNRSLACIGSDSVACVCAFVRALAAFSAAALLLLVSTGRAQAANPDSVLLTVAIGNQLSVRITDQFDADRLNYNFGTMLLGQSSVNTGEINIDNNSGGLVETFQLSVADNGSNGLLLRTTVGILAQDEYRLSALFQDAAPSPSAFGDEDILTVAPQTAESQGAAAKFAASTTPADEDGKDVQAPDRLAGRAANVRLWLKLELPAAATVNGLQTDFATVYVNAM